METLREWDNNWLEGGTRRRMAAVDSEGAIAGYSMSFRRPTELRGRFEIRIIVDRDCRNRGVGSILFDDADRFLEDQGATRVQAMVRDNCGPCLRFAKNRGFRQDRHMFESVLDVESFDSAKFDGAVERAREQGIRFFSFAETDGSAEQQRRLWELNAQTAQDVPGVDYSVRETWPFEQFQKDVFQARWFRPDGQILAEHNGMLVGLSAVGDMEPERFTNMHTGVLAGYRGLGIALALKLLTIECVRRHGGKSIRTNNDSANAPMLRVNEKLGYRPEPGWYILLKGT